MESLDTSAHTKEESVRILSEELEKHPVIVLTGPQGGGKTTLAIKLLDENVGAMLEGRAHFAQPVILIRKDFTDKMNAEVFEQRELPIFEGGKPLYVDVSYFDHLKYLLESVFDIMELGESELVMQIKELTEKLGVVPKEIELVASNEELVKRRLSRHVDAKERLLTLLDKEKEFNIESNLWGIQGARVADIINRKGVADYRNEQISRSVSDFDKVIPTKDMDITDCIKAMLEISNNEKRESSFLVLHKDNGEKKLVSDLVVGKDVHSIIGVTLLEVYVGFRQDRSDDRAYKHAEDGKLEVIHSFTPEIQKMISAADLFNAPDKGEYEFLSEDDVGAATRFDVIVSVIEADGDAESTNKNRQKELKEIMSGIVANDKDGK